MIPKYLNNKKPEKISLKRKQKMRLPKIKPAYLPKSLSPSPMAIRSKTPIFSPKSPTLDSYFDEFDKLIQKNTVIRKNWVSTKQNLLILQLNHKIGQISPSPINRSEFLNLN